MPKPINEIRVDARWLEPPKPMETVMQTLAWLRTGQAVRLPLYREPFSLLAERCRRDASKEADSSGVILIRRTRAAPDELSGANHTL